MFVAAKTVIRMNGDPDPGEVDRQEGPAVLAGKDATGLDRLPVPPIEPKDPVGFRDRIPAFDVGQLAAMGLTRPDMAVIEVAPQRLQLSCRSHTALGQTACRTWPAPVWWHRFLRP